MSLFIRVDNVGEWKGEEHKSYFGEVEEEMCEGGISCYEFKKGCVEDLYNYWKGIMITHSEGRQITVFEGEWIGIGSSMEYLAICTRTVCEMPASILFDNIDFLNDCKDGYEYYDEDEEEEIILDEEPLNIIEEAIILNVENASK